MPLVFCMAVHSEACKHDPTWCLTTPPLTFLVHSFLSYFYGECRSIGGRFLLALSSEWRKHYGNLCKSLHAISRSFLILSVLVTIWPVCVDGLICSESKARGCLLFPLASPSESWFLIDWISIWCRWISHHCNHGIEAIVMRFSSSPDNSRKKSGDRVLLYCFND